MPQIPYFGTNGARRTPVFIREIVFGRTENSAAISFCGMLLANICRIFETSSSLNFADQCASPRGTVAIIELKLKAWFQFCFLVQYSRFERWLLILFKSLWFTSGFSIVGSGKNVRAIRRWVLCFMAFPASVRRLSSIYPFLFFFCWIMNGSGQFFHRMLFEGLTRRIAPCVDAS